MSRAEMRAKDLSDRYQIEDEIGRGSIGVVHRGQDRSLGRAVAIKRMRPELVSQDRQRTRFLREAQLCARLGHPNIVPIYDVGELDGRPALVMALLAGRSLRTLVRTSQLPLGRVLGWFGQVCNGLAFAHAQGVIHRDVKPAHIFVGDFGQVVLTDWGLAKALRAPTLAALPDVSSEGSAFGKDSVTRVGDVVGTPAYMAPEQAEGRIAVIDHRADIYALGAILYELLTGTRPYEATRSADVLDQVRRGPPEPPRKRAPHRDIPAALEAVCLKAMAHDPGERFQSALDLAANVEALFEARGPRPDARELSAAREAEGDTQWRREKTLADAPRPSESTRADPAAALAEGLAEAAAWARHLQESRALRSESRRIFSNLPPEPPRRALQDLWRIETRARDAEERAAFHFVQAAEHLENGGALESGGESNEGRAALARLHRDAWRATESEGDPMNAQYHRARAEALDDGRLAGELARRSGLSVVTRPAGAIVDLSTVDDRGTLFTPGARLRLGKTPLGSRTVSASRATLKLTAPDGLAARIPLKLAPGEAHVVEAALPPSHSVPPGFVFVAGGRFVMGADDRAPGAGAPRELEVQSFCLARAPVTWEEYFEFLDDRLAAGRDPWRHAPRRNVEALCNVVDGRMTWKAEVFAPPGSPVRWVSQADAAAYAQWLGRRLGAHLRLPDEHEWEYAAGGADGRAYPWGDQFAPGLADNKWRRARGPAPLAGFPDDESPFGVRNVAGGVSEWTRTPSDDEPDRVLVRGGSWRSRPDQCRVAARATMPANATHEGIGIRLAADLPGPESA
jgi:serine/threonine-protein kinase